MRKNQMSNEQLLNEIISTTVKSVHYPNNTRVFESNKKAIEEMCKRLDIDFEKFFDALL